MNVTKFWIDSPTEVEAPPPISRTVAKSPMLRTKTKTAPITMPGRASGRRISHRMFHQRAPISRAASSTAGSMVESEKKIGEIMKSMYNWAMATRTAKLEKSKKSSGAEMIPSESSAELSTPSRPIMGIQAIARMRKLVKKGASAMMKSAKRDRRLGTTSAR